VIATVERKLNEAAENGRVAEVLSVLRDNPGLNVNWTNNDNIQWTALHHASISGHVEVVKVLLAHPGITVNCKDIVGQTPFSLGCEGGNVSVVCVLLKDPRVDVTMADNMGCTPLWYASRDGHHEVVERLMASGRDLGDIGNTKGKYGGEEFTALEIARENENSEVVSLLENFMDNPTQTPHELRMKLGVLDELAAELFALTVFLCDDLLHLKITSLPARFFSIATRLPMELQMILCHRAVGSMKQNVLHKDSEASNPGETIVFESKLKV